MAKSKHTVNSRKQIAINSLDDLNKLHAQEVKVQRVSRYEMFRRALAASGMTANLDNFDTMRADFLRFAMDGPKDIDAECGYPSWLTPDHYRLMYDREGIAKRVVDCEPEESWAVDPEVYEDEDPSVETDFEAALDDLVEKHNIWHYLQRIDVLSGIGQFGILMFGLDDGISLDQPVEGINDDGTFAKGNKYNMHFMRPFSEDVVFVKLRETNTENPRYGLPVMYTIHFRDFPNWGVQAGEIVARDVHWTRVLHVADNRKMSEIYGIPRMQPVWNRLYDLRKTYSASGEAYWKGAFPGMAFEVNPELADQGIELDAESIRKEMEKFSNGLQRYMALTGVVTKTIPPQIVDPTGTIETHLKAIAISKGIPYRVLFGSEEAKLASDQDSRAWNKRLAKRQSKYLTPMLVRPFIERMIAYGILPAPKKFFVDWPDLNAPTDLDKAQVAVEKTNAIATYVQSGAQQLVPPNSFFTHVLGMTQEEKDAIMEDAQDFNDENNAPPGEGQEDQEGSEGSLTIKQPDAGNALEQTELSGSLTGGAKRNDAQLVYMPSMNSSGRKFVRNFNEHHDEHGRFASADGAGSATDGNSPANAVMMSSPAVKEYHDLAEVQKASHTPAEQAAVHTAHRIAVNLGVKAKALPAMGVWADGGEPAVFTKYTGDFEKVRVAAAMQGVLYRQKMVIPFKNDPKGPDTMWHLDVKNKDVKEIHQRLLDKGIAFHTIIEHPDRTSIMVYDEGNKLASNVKDFSDGYTKDVKYYKGKGEFLGSWDDREEGVKACQKVVDEYRAKLGAGHDLRWFDRMRHHYWNSGALTSLSEGPTANFNEAHDQHGRFTFREGAAAGGDKWEEGTADVEDDVSNNPDGIATAKRFWVNPHSDKYLPVELSTDHTPLMLEKHKEFGISKQEIKAYEQKHREIDATFDARAMNNLAMSKGWVRVTRGGNAVDAGSEDDARAAIRWNNQNCRVKPYKMDIDITDERGNVSKSISLQNTDHIRRFLRGDSIDKLNADIYGRGPSNNSAALTRNYNPNHDEQGRFAESASVGSQVSSIAKQLDAGNMALSRTRGASGAGMTAAADKVTQGTKEEKEKIVERNAQTTAELVHHYATVPADPRSPGEVKKMLTDLAGAVNDGITPPGKTFREWDTKTAAIKGTAVPGEFDKFAGELFKRWGEVKTDPVKLAAYAEWKIGPGDLHPFYDGCGRTSRAVAAAILLRGGKQLPKYTNTTEYFEHGKDLSGFTNYFRSLVPEGKATLNYDPEQPRDEDGRWTDGATADKLIAKEKEILKDADVKDIETAQGLKPIDPKDPKSMAGTTADWKNARGKWVYERQAMHDKWVGEEVHKATPVPADQKQMVIMGGGTASGKSSLIKSGMVKPDNFVRVDADALKEKIPEYNRLLELKDPKAASYVHEESSELAKNTIEESLKTNRNVLHDGTGDSGLEKFMGKIEKYRALGVKRIVGEYATCPISVAQQRADSAARDPKSDRFGRFIDPAEIEHIHRSVSAILPEAIKRGAFDECRLWDTNVPKGQAPKLIMEYKDGKLDPKDPVKWKAFQDKAQNGDG